MLGAFGAWKDVDDDTSAPARGGGGGGHLTHTEQVKAVSKVARSLRYLAGAALRLCLGQHKLMAFKCRNYAPYGAVLPFVTTNGGGGGGALTDTGQDHQKR